MKSSKSQSLLSRRTLECLAIMMIGDGVATFVEPHRHVSLWRRGPALWSSLMNWFTKNIELTRWLGAAEALAGLWLASRQRP